MRDDTNDAGDTLGKHRARDGTSFWSVRVGQGEISRPQETGGASNWDARHGVGLVVVGGLPSQ